MLPSFRTDAARAAALAGHLAVLHPQAAWFFPRAQTQAGRLHETEFVLAWVGICHRTRGLQAIVNGRLLHGSDALAQRFREVLDIDPSRFEASRLAMLNAEELAGWFADAPAPLTRVQERCALLNDLGRWLQTECGGTLAGAITASKGKLAGAAGLFARLARTRAYRDPVRKKSHLLLQTLRAMSLFEAADPDACGLPIDNHLIRVFLRTGVLVPTNQRAFELAAGVPCNAEEDLLLRSAALAASAPMAAVAALAHIDPLLWMVGRNCCSGERTPVCSVPQQPDCNHATDCSLRASTAHECGLRCPLQASCANAGSASKFREPEHDTDLY
ncbi:MAG: hypothetical protein EXS14_05630 [Planctomycetes bacterium]|nr:hypothetical protein [Planctomycetota bacterium]